MEYEQRVPIQSLAEAFPNDDPRAPKLPWQWLMDQPDPRQLPLDLPRSPRPITAADCPF